ncbi:MAG: DUF465 domain-containing protein [Sneathiella sp.]
MSHVPHELAEEFPELTQKMHDLKASNLHFSRRFDEYHQINRQVHRSETNVEPVSDDVMNNLRKRRMNLKDEIYGILTSN